MTVTHTHTVHLILPKYGILSNVVLAVVFGMSSAKENHKNRQYAKVIRIKIPGCQIRKIHNLPFLLLPTMQSNNIAVSNAK